MARCYWRGHAIHTMWVYSDSHQKVEKNPNRKCGNCNKPNRKDGHDACLGKLPGVMNACCGHGRTKEAYIQFLDKFCIKGQDAKNIIRIIKKYRGQHGY